MCLFPNSSTKQKAFCLSSVNSFVISLCSGYINFVFYNYDSISLTCYIIQILTVSYFTSYLICDLCLGVFYYSEYLDFLTAYFHHFLYIGLNIAVILTDNTFIYCLYLISEIPTFILTIGSLNNRLRMDKLFGFVFFSTRIIYHSFLISLFYLPNNFFPMTKFFNPEIRSLATFLASSILGLHFYWFSKWYTKYYK
jgi:hypothetical protein